MILRNFAGFFPPQQVNMPIVHMTFTYFAQNLIEYSKNGKTDNGPNCGKDGIIRTMCNIAGYVGERDAAPILLEMMSREAGFGGGYYTGLATMADGELHWDKVLGDMDLLKKAIKGKSFPGHVGIIHSRSNSGGDREWAHPFISNDEKIAYVANGSYGAFAELNGSKRDTVAMELENRGVRYSSKSNPVGRYPRLSDGTGVHVSEVMCHLIRTLIMDGFEPEAATRRAFTAYPSEIGALALDTDVPDAILAARYNQPMMLGRAADGVYLATTAMAFPPDVKFLAIDVLPACCSATIRKDGWTIHGFESVLPVTPLDASMYRSAQNIFLRCINAASEPVSVGKCCNLVKRFHKEGEIFQDAVLAYEALRPLVEAGRIKVEKLTVPGAPEGGGTIKSTAFRFVKAD